MYFYFQLKCLEELTPCCGCSPAVYTNHTLFTQFKTCMCKCTKMYTNVNKCTQMNCRIKQDPRKIVHFVHTKFDIYLYTISVHNKWYVIIFNFCLLYLLVEFQSWKDSQNIKYRRKPNPSLEVYSKYTPLLVKKRINILFGKMHNFLLHYIIFLLDNVEGMGPGGEGGGADVVIFRTCLYMSNKKFPCNFFCCVLTWQLILK